jgi:CBS domain-containing protein
MDDGTSQSRIVAPSAVPEDRLTNTLSETRTTKRLGHTAAGVSRLELRRQPARVLARPEPPPTVTPRIPLADALALMRQSGGAALLVADEGGGLVGILTERDVLKRVLGRELEQGRPVSDFMTADPHTLPADASLLEAMRAMETGNYRNLPLVDEDGQVIGMLRQQDLLEYIAEAFPQEILNLPPRPHQTMEEPEGA